MNDDTRKLLKVFGVAVTDAEAERLAGTAAQLSAGSRSRSKVARSLAATLAHRLACSAATARVN